MKPLAGTLVFIATALSGCVVSFGTIGTWSNEKPPPTSIQGTNSTVMPDGELVVLGGIDSRTGQPLNQVLRFNPKDNRWSEGAPMPVQQAGYALAALSNGSVLVAGGSGGGGGNGLLATTWLYSPQLNTWRKVGNLHVARSGGGTDFFGFINSAETFDPKTNSWSLVGSMHVARGSTALVALPHGLALAAGGCALANQGFTSNVALTSTEVFDPTGTWTVTAPLPEPRCGASGLTLRDGRALLTGGSFSNFERGSVTTAFLYEEKTHAWTAAGSTIPGASTPILLADGRVFVAAMQAGPVQGHVASVVVGGQVFDPNSGDWRFATSTSVQISSRLGPEDSPTVVAEPAGTAVVLLGTAGLAFTFNPFGVPPHLLILDSSGLALVLACVAAALCLWLAIQYIRDRVHKAA
jgi:N-acetylneuraminic acid mutarotase